MINSLSSLACLGLSSSEFRLVHEDEMAPDFDHGATHLHRNGQTCPCPCECVEFLEDEGMVRTNA
jgi:hypothetical protein